MIRPITIVTFLLACGSGLYVYQSKHEVQVLDRTIEKTVHETGALREQSRLLAAEWTMLNDPERLRQFSDAYLNLKSINPAQFISLNDLDSKLPAPLPEAPPTTDEAPLVAQTAPRAVPEPAPSVAASEPVPPEAGAPEAGAPEAGAPEAGAPEAVAENEAIPVPPVPAVRPVLAATPPVRPSEARVAVARPAVAVPAEPRVVEQRGPEQRVDQRAAEPRVGTRVVEAHPDVRPQLAQAPRPIVLPRPQPVYAAAQPQPRPQPMPAPYRPAAVAPAPGPAPGPAPFTGSLLGMARGPMPAAPRPMPVNATYNAN